jgi:hypothetical protein
VKKELRPVHDSIACDVCGRSMLKGERTETFLAPGGHRHQVCDLCFARAEQAGWIREAAAGEAPARIPRQEQRVGLLGRLRRRRVESSDGADAVVEEAPRDREEPAFEHPDEEDLAPAPPPQPRSRPKDPRHVRAVPTTAEVKVERALELFNGSDHQRTIAGLARTLGTPYVAVAPDLDAPSAVEVLVAWELSWYHFRVDLGDDADPVVMVEKGEELGEIDESLRSWNATIDARGRLVAGVGSER